MEENKRKLSIHNIMIVAMLQFFVAEICRLSMETQLLKGLYATIRERGLEDETILLSQLPVLETINKQITIPYTIIAGPLAAIQISLVGIIICLIIRANKQYIKECLSACGMVILAECMITMTSNLVPEVFQTKYELLIVVPIVMLCSVPIYLQLFKSTSKTKNTETN